MNDWKIFRGNVGPHDELVGLPDAPPWRMPGRFKPLARPAGLDLDKETARAEPFIVSAEMVLAVNTALYLRRPLLITGQPGSGKSTLISKVAHELKLGPVIRWPINSRTSLRSGLYEYDAIGRLQAKEVGGPVPNPEEFLTLGPLGTALLADTWPRALLIDEIDKSDLDFANDLLNVIEEGEYEIPELRRLGTETHRVRDYFGTKVSVTGGQVRCSQFPFVVMTSNAEREFPLPFLRRCVRLTVAAPDEKKLAEILNAHLALGDGHDPEITRLISAFRKIDEQGRATDQLLNAVFLTVAIGASGERTFDAAERSALEANLLKQLSAP